MPDLYLLDSNVFIEAATRYYAFGTVPGFWTWVEGLAATGTLQSVSMVQDEVQHPQDLVDWLGDREAEGFFVDISEPEIQFEYQELAAWIIGQSFGPAHVGKFMDGADLWIVAAARVHNATVVTQEDLIVGSDSHIKKIKIPNVCKHHGVPCMNTFELLSALGAHF